MAKIATPSTSSQRPETGKDDPDASDFQDSRIKRAQKNVYQGKTSNTPPKNPKRGRSEEKLKEAYLKSRFSYVPKKCRAENEVDGNECTNGSSKPVSRSSSHSTKGEINGVNKTAIRESFTPKSDFVINFHSSGDTSIEPDGETVEMYRSSLCTSKNIMHYMNNISQGQNCSAVLKQIRKGPVINHVAGMEKFAHYSPFERRVTALTFHPKYPSFLAAGSKGGKVIFWDTTEWTHKAEIPAIGPGGSVLALKFDHENPMHVYTASLTGKIQRQDFLGRETMTFFETGKYHNWFCSMDTCVPRKLLLAGDTHGHLHLANFDGKKLWKTQEKVHKGKVTHIEFSTWDPNVFITASLDHTIRIWDSRMISLKPESCLCLHRCTQEMPVNSAYFSPSNGKSLLTTDQHSELRVYTAPLWNLQTSIRHPHRQFQHLTSIKAQWHPLEDLIIVGRYPDDNFSRHDFRSIDLYDAHTGKREHYFSTIGIVSLNAFSPDGGVLASASGTNIMLWKSKEMCNDSSKLSTDVCKKLLHSRAIRRSRPTNSSGSKLVTTNLKKKQKDKH